MKKVSTAAMKTERGIFLNRSWRSDWIWEIAPVGIARWTKQHTIIRKRG